jgi:hypothetical protein
VLKSLTVTAGSMRRTIASLLGAILCANRDTFEEAAMLRVDSANVVALGMSNQGHFRWYRWSRTYWTSAFDGHNAQFLVPRTANKPGMRARLAVYPSDDSNNKIARGFKRLNSISVGGAFSLFVMKMLSILSFVE